MKAAAPVPSGEESRRAALSGFTLAELMTASAIFSLVVIAVVYSHLLGLRMFNITATKLSASANARAALNELRDEIRSAKMLQVGNGNNFGFTNIVGNALRQGNALQIYPTTATNTYARYYMDTQAQELKRVVAGSTTAVVISQFITNQVAFAAEDYAGNVLTTDQNNRVIRMSLQFYQWEFPVARGGVGAYYDYYPLQTRMTRRTIE
ncbi:MAG TPA: hypothetical protein VNZ64_20460 [Candidatus Acidoferrum sp.]|jgi:hypothetical protein|nr:hypothetical protein [Candidatus Acidoferrum sp.]